jgi:hypothetical protein
MTYSSSLLFPFLVGASGCGHSPSVVLTITDASARQEREYLDVQCTAALNNRTGSSLSVTSIFASAFDGLRLVVTSEDGTRLAEQAYVMHQSPFDIPGRAFALPSGVTTQRMSIPVFAMTNTPAKVKLQLIGSLPQSSYTGTVASTVINVPVPR